MLNRHCRDLGEENSVEGRRTGWRERGCALPAPCAGSRSTACTPRWRPAAPPHTQTTPWGVSCPPAHPWAAPAAADVMHCAGYAHLSVETGASTGGSGPSVGCVLSLQRRRLLQARMLGLAVLRLAAETQMGKEGAGGRFTDVGRAARV